MSRSLGNRLPGALLERFSQRDLPHRLGTAVTFVTIDADLRPHPMLLSYLEFRAHDAGSLGLVILGRSRSARNLAERGTGTLIVVEPDATFYVKVRALDGPLPVPGGEPFELGYFLLAVEDVLEDAAAEWEGGMRITGAITYAPPPSLEEPWARATLAALATPHARA